MAAVFRYCSLSILLGLVSAQMQFTQPNGSLADMSQTFVVGETVILRWQGGWKGYGAAPDFVDLFLVSFNSDAYIDLVITNISLASGNLYNWRVNVPEETVKSEKNFAFKFVTAQNPPNYIQAQPAKVLSPSRGFKVALAANAASVTSTRTLVASSSTAASSLASSAATSTPAASSTPSTSPTSAAANASGGGGGSSTPVGAIVGGVVGGLAVVALGVVALLMLRMMKRKKAQGSAPGYIPEMGDTQTAPPMYPTSQAQKYELNSPPMVQELPGNHMPVEADSNYQGRLAR
ncbi:hypothetical protein CC86DRAFT_409760 [Ophiobolus disseminans]|uniref:Mid2 domain-containing protein n=1 Tax=Ophiobolus disseminans TaxID=1469910 RepID=A0A6A6ZQU6_9PLEO|nr:hypothetical protein CC86DRAFT_409760 [Ophiobolus disseminans]